jgi:hypothetical protein
MRRLLLCSAGYAQLSCDVPARRPEQRRPPESQVPGGRLASDLRLLLQDNDGTDCGRGTFTHQNPPASRLRPVKLKGTVRSLLAGGFWTYNRRSNGVS